METASWLVLVGVVAVLALLVGAVGGAVLLANDADVWVREAAEDRRRLTGENEQLRARLETYRTDAAKEFEARG